MTTPIAELTSLLLSAGLSADVVTKAIDLAQQHAEKSADVRRQSADSPVDEATERRRAYDRDRQRTRRAEIKAKKEGPQTPKEKTTSQDFSDEKSFEAAVAAQPIYTDSTHELWNEGVAILGQLGVREKSARSNIGRWLRDNRNDAAGVLSAIHRARDARTRDPIPFVTGALKTGGNGRGPPAQSGNGFDNAIADLTRARNEQPSEPPDQDLFGTTAGGPVIDGDWIRSGPR